MAQVTMIIAPTTARVSVIGNSSESASALRFSASAWAWFSLWNRWISLSCEWVARTIRMPANDWPSALAMR
jgi:hypothetical protein